eukprot:6460325-Pyramimonas_sp.AAC.1
MAGTADAIGKYAKCVEDMFGECKFNKHTYTYCDVIYIKDDDGNVTLDQDEYIKQPRRIQHPELTSAGGRHVRQPQRCAGVRAGYPGMVDGICCISTACPRADRYSSATTERDHWKVTGLSEEDRLPGDEPRGRGRLT